MAHLASDIRDYYFSHFAELPQDKQFHFVSRLSSWTHDTEAREKLAPMLDDLTKPTIRTALREFLENPPTAKINAAERRAPYFAKYPNLRAWMLALFRVRHLLFHYNIDERATLTELINVKELYELSDALQHDTEALAVLSTYAINFIYLVEVILYPREETTLDTFLERIIATTHQYDTTAEDSLLLIYLFTHCIIGASNFYQQRVTDRQYTRMLEILETRIADEYDHINLDNKCEFLVCCELAGFDTTLRSRIHQEAERSISPDGTFIVDTENTAGQHNKTTFTDSEHRNVLYIMSTLPFRAK